MKREEGRAEEARRGPRGQPEGGSESGIELPKEAELGRPPSREGSGRGRTNGNEKQASKYETFRKLLSGGRRESTNRNQTESLILAQDKRWRRA